MVDDGSDKRFSKIKQVPKDRIVGTLEGNWRGEIRWKKVGESVSYRLLYRQSAGERASLSGRDLRLTLSILAQSSVPLVDLLPLNVVPKAVAPLEEQGPMETRKVWASVVDALNKKDYSTASKEKQRIEQEQRDKAEERKKKGEVCVSTCDLVFSVCRDGTDLRRDIDHAATGHASSNPSLTTSPIGTAAPFSPPKAKPPLSATSRPTTRPRLRPHRTAMTIALVPISFFPPPRRLTFDRQRFPRLCCIRSLHFPLS